MIHPKCNKCGVEIEEPGGAIVVAPPQTPWPWKFHLCLDCFKQFLTWINRSQNLCYRKLPEPTPAQAQCKHEKWLKMKPQPRHCLECGLLMWDAGD